MKTKHDLNNNCLNLSLRAREKLKTKQIFSVNFISGIERLQNPRFQRIVTNSAPDNKGESPTSPADTASNDPESLHKQGADRDITREMNFASC